MADLSNSSFIPKRSPTTNTSKGPARQVYVFTLFSYILLFATLIGAGGVFFYGKIADRNLDKAIVELKKEIGSFNDADMRKVQEFDVRLKQASQRLNNSASIVSILEALEVATIDTVQISSLVLEREDDDKFLLSASINTDSFDSTLFQRGVYKRKDDTISSVLIKDMTTSNLNNQGSTAEGSGANVTFVAEIEIPLSSVPYKVRDVDIRPVSLREPIESSTSSSTADQESDGNENNI